MSSFSVNTFIGLFKQNFPKCIQGYHLVNSDPIKESVWEAINTQIFSASGCKVFSSSDGSHAPGSDISCTLGGISNKSTKLEQDIFNMSSYRLTKVCGSDNYGDITTILAEINKRKNFQYYSIIARNEESKSHNIEYYWYLIPGDHCLMTQKPIRGDQCMANKVKIRGYKLAGKQIPKIVDLK